MIRAFSFLFAAVRNAPAAAWAPFWRPTSFGDPCSSSTGNHNGGTEVISSYEIRAVCRQDIEEHIRALMITAVRNSALSLVAVYSEDNESTNRVEVIADVTVAGRPDAKLNKTAVKLRCHRRELEDRTSDAESELVSEA